MHHIATQLIWKISIAKELEKPIIAIEPWVLKRLQQ